MDSSAGVLLHITSLPSGEGIGTLGRAAFEFVDFLAFAGVGVWQVLPLVPTEEGNSPYYSATSSAFNPLLIDCARLAEQGLLEESDLALLAGDAAKVDYRNVRTQKEKLLKKAFERFDKTSPEFALYEASGKSREYALFELLRQENGYAPFREWKGGFNVYDAAAADAYIAAHRSEYLYLVFTQYVFEKQWFELKAYANKKGVKILGDMPIYLAPDCVEMWAHKERFLLDGNGNSALVAGVPPDYFNENGQLWGNPLYNWEGMKRDGYAWWRGRIDAALSMCDMLRIDHFRGLDRFYAVEATAADAKHGVWLPAAGAELFKGYENAPIIAEDLGYVDDSLRAMLAKVGYPGMKVAEFGFNGDAYNEHNPSNYTENCVAYSGTHDNMPLMGWLADMDADGKARLEEAVARECNALGVTACTGGNAATAVTVIKLVLASKARLTVFPLQDLLLCGNEARMNTPAVVSDDNWAWRVDKKALNPVFAMQVREWLHEAGRA